MGRRRRAATAVAVLLGGLLTACTSSHPLDGQPPWAHLPWRAGSLPVPDGTRALVRDATWCGGRWAVVGATADARGATRPAVWSSPDGRSFRAGRLDPGSDYYAARAILTSVGCSRGRLAAVGAKSGGAHGLPRTATWRERPDGVLAAVRAPFPLFGGSTNVAVSRLAGGPAGYLVTGTRTSGAAVWTSPSGTSFRLHEGTPGLASTPSIRTQALDAVADAHGWVVAGTGTDDSGRLVATVWSGRGDRWRRQALPGGRTISTAERATRVGAGPVVAGLLDDSFGLWLRQGGRWSLDGSFGERDAGATSAAYVSGLAWTGGLVVATYSDGRQFRLAIGGSSPGEADLPTAVTVRGDHTVTVATHGEDALLLTDDGQRGRVWSARVPGPTS
ncbi:MAG TPA: hypothetical protein VFJ89_06240 [Nocardioides sp.]|nr:hypothetical protein [Nocardioides sp.]